MQSKSIFLSPAIDPRLPHGILCISGLYGIGRNDCEAAMAEWMYRKDGVEFGPISSAQLVDFADSGQLEPAEKVWRVGSKKPVSGSKLAAVIARFHKRAKQIPKSTGPLPKPAKPLPDSAKPLPASKPRLAQARWLTDDGWSLIDPRKPAKPAKPSFICPVCQQVVTKLIRHLRESHNIWPISRVGAWTFSVAGRPWALCPYCTAAMPESDLASHRLTMHGKQHLKALRRTKKGIRVNLLARELGVESKSILAKLRDEGLAEVVPNHMSTVTLGLAESVRKWFSEKPRSPGMEQDIAPSEALDVPVPEVTALPVMPAATQAPAVDWKYRKGGVEFGPFTRTQLMDLAGQGELKSAEMVWRVGSNGTISSGNAKPSFTCPICQQAVRRLISHLAKTHGIESSLSAGVYNFSIDGTPWVLSYQSNEFLQESLPTYLKRHALPESVGQEQKAIRVNVLARQLGVESKTILAKLRDEGLAGLALNHMSCLSRGLEESVREWFKQPGHTGGTAVQIAPTLPEGEAPTQRANAPVVEGPGPGKAPIVAPVVLDAPAPEVAPLPLATAASEGVIPSAPAAQTQPAMLVDPAMRVVESQRRPEQRVPKTADLAGGRVAGVKERPKRYPDGEGGAHAPRTHRTSREVTPESIGTTGTAEDFDEIRALPSVSAEATRDAARIRLNRVKRHNLLVRKLAGRLDAAHARLYEDPFDVLAVIEQLGILAEIKTLDGTEMDERERVREALSQLLYYEQFATRPIGGDAAICKVACFEKRITIAHAQWLNRHTIAVIWQADSKFSGDALAGEFLGQFLQELR